MTPQQWEAIERSLTALSLEEKRELADHLLHSIRAESSEGDRVRQQRDALARLCRTTDAMPTVDPGDGLTNRDHDRILYGR